MRERPSPVLYALNIWYIWTLVKNFSRHGFDAMMAIKQQINLYNEFSIAEEY